VSNIYACTHSSHLLVARNHREKQAQNHMNRPVLRANTSDMLIESASGITAFIKIMSLTLSKALVIALDIDQYVQTMSTLKFCPGV
jgi:hypothetical protein